MQSLFSQIPVPNNLDFLADEMNGKRFDTTSFIRYGDRNYLKGKDGKTIRLKWLKNNGSKLDSFANDFINQYGYILGEEDNVIESAVEVITSYPTGATAYFKSRIEDIEIEAANEIKHYENMKRKDISDNDIANEIFEQTIKSAIKKGAKRSTKKTVKQTFTKDFLLLRRLVNFNNKTVTISQLNKFSIDANAALKGSINNRALLKKAVGRIDFLIFKLDGKKITKVKKLEVSTDLLQAATNVVQQPKIKAVVLGSTAQTKKKASTISEFLNGIEVYTKQEAESLGILEDGLSGAGKPKNPYDVVNRVILNQLQKGVVPWEMPWAMNNGNMIAPQNYGSKRPYRGVNLWSIVCDMDMRNHEVPYFLTSKQVADKGGKIAKGAKPYYITYYGKFNVTEIEIDKATGETDSNEKSIRFLKLYAVYNIEDTDLDFEKPNNKPAKKVDRINSAEVILEAMPKKPKIKFGGNQAFYSPTQDLVQMPKIENFKVVDRYYSTFFHELVHSTKNDKRCGTDHFRKNSKAYGDKQYSWEELVAELGASYLCSEAGIFHKTVGQSAAYIKGWASSLQQYIKDNKRYFFKASNYAQKAADFILNKSNSISGVDEVAEIIKIAKDVYPNATVKEIKPSSQFTSMDKLESGGVYQLKGELGKLLGNLGEIDCSISLKGDQGAGKSQLMWQMVNSFANAGKRVAVVCPEMNGKSPTISKYRDQYLSKENQQKILFTDAELSVKDLIRLQADYDVLFVDSFNLLEDYEQSQFKELCKSDPTKCIIGLFQSTTSGEMRGGNKPEFNAYINLEVVKVDNTFKNNYAICTKNRFGGTGAKYNISKQKIVK